MMNERADNVINFKTTARFSSVTQSMGAPVFNISGEDRAIWVNGIFENSYASCKFILQPNRIKGVFQIEMLTCDYRARKDGLKFRKISAATPQACADKLAAWVTKNGKFFA
jgi:uncharacterized protein with WD repeat